MSKRRILVRVLCLGVLSIVVLLTDSSFSQQQGREFRRPRPVVRPGSIPDELTALTWRHVGPQGNRVSAVVCDSNDPNVYYAGACAGGVWKST
ncbi:MAG: hypothetical protein OEW05_09300, partial [Candidatus Aminicenantes bacterium]|nr:hypothetical protein [Candidatus Aminicenantes bacterium]